jgi:hypothetical protein
MVSINNLKPCIRKLGRLS